MTELESFQTQNPARFAVQATIRYDDLDPNRHVNHAKYLTYLEECRLALRRHLNTELKLPEALGWAVGALSILYRRALLYPGTVTIDRKSVV